MSDLCLSKSNAYEIVDEKHIFFHKEFVLFHLDNSLDKKTNIIIPFSISMKGSKLLSSQKMSFVKYLDHYYPMGLSEVVQEKMARPPPGSEKSETIKVETLDIDIEHR
jgi:hypothetical protein